MKLIISSDYRANVNTGLLGYTGEANARTIEVEQPEVDGADTYRLRFDYGNDTIYDVPIEDGKILITGSLLPKAGQVKCQWLATAAEGESYKLVAKSNIFALRIGDSISNDITPVPSYEQSVEAMDKVLAYESSAAEYAEQAQQSADTVRSIERDVQILKTEAESAAQAAAESARAVESAAEEFIGDANIAKTELQKVVNDSQTTKSDLSEAIDKADNLANELDEATSAANEVLQSLISENDAAEANLDDLKSENFNSQEILTGVADLRAYLGLAGDDVLGLQVDFENKIFTRLAGAANLTAGADFDKFSMFGGRKKCTVADDGTITSWYGDENYTENGSIGQVMVYQPKFYYLVYPVKLEPIETGIGYHLRKVNYYISRSPKPGFKLHPAFYDANGDEIDYYLTSAYEGSIWDADGGEDGTGAYLLLDEQVMNTTTDKLCSIAGVKPASGLTQKLTRTNVESLANNRGENWHGDLIKLVSAEQLLMIIEIGNMNLQTAIANGVVYITDNSSYNCSSLTGSTASLGNGTGQATETTNEKGGATTVETANGKTSICWRGKENFWGNIWKFVYGVNIWGNGKMGGGQPYICNDFNFEESKNNDNYEGAGFTATNANGYISAIGYSTNCDWMFMASECLGNSSLPVGDKTNITQNLNGYRVTLLGGRWYHGNPAGGFYWLLTDGVGYRYRVVGGRLVYVPTKDSAAYTAAIASWESHD